jgi:hypothetical protein
MPVAYRFDSNIIVIEMVGEYSLDDIRMTILNSLADSKCPTTPFILVNLSGSRSIYNRSSDDVKTIALSLASLAKRFNNRIALVAPDDFPYGLMRMGSVFSAMAGFEPEVFRTYADARKWILS